MAEPKVARLAGSRPSTRTAESPRPIPQMVLLPYISFKVANSDAVIAQSRDSGFVTIGPTITDLVAARIWE